MTIKGNKDIQDVYHAIESNDWVREPDQDPLFANTILFMSSVGNNGANNNVYLDSSTNNFTITRNGDTYQGSHSPHNPNGWSAYFDGNGDFLSTSTNVMPTSGDFCLECWFWVENALAYAITGGQYVSRLISGVGTNVMEFCVAGTGTSSVPTDLGLRTYGTANFSMAAAGLTIPVNTWNHVAAMRNGSNCAIFLNGARVTNTVTGTSTYTFAAAGARIGGASDAAAGYLDYFKGYMSSVRIVSGSSVYDPTKTTITVPTGALAAISNTSLLTLQSNSFKDNSTNNLTITRNGDTKILPISPFRMDTLYNANTHGGSAYFDGTGDYLSIANNSAFAPAALDFTIEAWVYINALTAGGQTIFGQADSAGTVASGIYFYACNASGFPQLASPQGGSNNLLTSTTAIAIRQWNHIAVARYGAIITIYVNGIASGTINFGALALTASTQINSIGRNGAGNFEYLNGYISNFRFVKGTAVYTGNFTPPSAPVSQAGDATMYSSTANVNTTFAAANTSLLCNFTNAGIIDLSGKNNIYTVGATQVSTSIFKDSKSFYFDGSGYYYFTDDIQYMYAKPITIEAWMYPTTSGTLRTFVEENTGGDNGEQYIALTSGNVFYFEQRSSHGYPVGGASTLGLATTATVNSNTWTHVAIVFSSTGLRMYVNGVLSASNAGVRYWNNAARKLNLGIQGYGFGNYIGYIEDFRITLGERYRANFTPLKLKRY